MSLRGAFVWALPVSVALNAFLATVLVWPLVDGPPDMPPPGGPGDRRGGPPWEKVERLTRDLPAADAALVLAAFAAERETLEANDARMKTIPGRLSAALGAEPFDAEAVVKVFREGAETQATTMAALERTIVNTAGKLSPEGRKLLAERLKPPPRAFLRQPDGPDRCGPEGQPPAAPAR